MVSDVSSIDRQSEPSLIRQVSNVGYILAVIHKYKPTPSHKYKLALLHKYKLTILNKCKTSLLQILITLISQILRRSYEEILRESMISSPEVLSGE